MDLFDLLIIGAVIYAMLRGMARAGRKAGAPQEPEEPPLEAREWSEDMGDVLEGLGFPRPSGPSQIPQAPAGPQDVPTEEAAGLATAEAREPVKRGRALADIAALAEPAARKRARPLDVARREVTAPARKAEGTSRAGSRLPRLAGYSELERAIVYAEILAPPKALRD
jgi:hypothetical protein